MGVFVYRIHVSVHEESVQKRNNLCLCICVCKDACLCCYHKSSAGRFWCLHKHEAIQTVASIATCSVNMLNYKCMLMHMHAYCTCSYFFYLSPTGVLCHFQACQNCCGLRKMYFITECTETLANILLLFLFFLEIWVIFLFFLFFYSFICSVVLQAEVRMRCVIVLD